nr:reverse transcriptase domain-containing protein [Tanacetum cinerariifolium]
MRTRFNFYPFNSNATIPRLSNRRRVPNIVEPEIRTIEEVVLMADRTMEKILQAPTKWYGEAIVILEILAENFGIKTNLLQLVQANKFHGFYRDNPHTHISNFKRMTATLKYRDVPNDAIKLILFPYSLEGAARIWYEKEASNSILNWDDLETFGEAWDRFKEMLRACPHHKFSELTQIDTFYNGLNEQDQDFLNVVAGGNLLNKTTIEALKIIENKSKVRYSRSKSNVSRVNTNSRDNVKINLVFVRQLVLTIKCLRQTELATKYHHLVLLRCKTSNQGEMKAVTTRSGLAYEGPLIPTNSPLEIVVEQNTKEIMDKEHSNCQGSTAQVEPLVVPISIPEHDVLRTQPNPTIPYPSRLNDQKLREKATNQMEKMDVCHALADLGASINLMPLSIWKKLLLPELTPTRMTLELADRFQSRSKSSSNPREIILENRSCFNRCIQRLNYPHDFIDIACEEFVQDVLDFQYNPKGSNPTLVFDPLNYESDFSKEPIVKSSSPTLTPFGESYLFLEEIEDFLNDDTIPTGIDNSFYDP